MSLRFEFMVSASAQNKVRDIYDFCKELASAQNEKIFLVEAREANRTAAYIVIECSEEFGRVLTKETKSGAIRSVTKKAPVLEYSS